MALDSLPMALEPVTMTLDLLTVALGLLRPVHGVAPTLLDPGTPLLAPVRRVQGLARTVHAAVFRRHEAVAHSPEARNSWMDPAALRPAPMARMTVAAPVTMSPPAKTPRREARRLSGSAAM